MRTGVVRQIVKCDYICQAHVCGRDALYYTGVTDGKLAVNRLYIPTMQLDVLYDDFPEGTPYVFSLYGPQDLVLEIPRSTQGNIVIRCINPEMMKLIDQETSNPDSKYNVEMQGLDIQILWDKTEVYDADIISRMRLWLCEFIQKDTGVRTFLEITYNPQEGTETRRLGIIDSCWTGSGYPHDHFNPEITEKEDPVFELGEWVDIPGLKPVQGSVSTMLYSDQFAPYTLYRYGEGKLKEKLTVIPVISADGQICVTEDNLLIQVSGDGSICNALYQGKDRIRHLNRLGEKLYFLDGDTMIELDIENAKYRTLLEYTGIVEMYLDNSWDELEDDYARIYFSVGEGLFIAGYQYNMQTGELVKGYRL